MSSLSQFTQIPSITDSFSLEDVTARLAAREDVAALVLIGSTGQSSIKAYSDYDLLLFMSVMPVPLHVLFTTINGVLTDVIFGDTAVIERILTSENLAVLTKKDGSLMYWLAHGRIVHDRDGRVRQAQTRLQNEPWSFTISEQAQLSAWNHINYNWLQTRRMLAADDLVYKTAVEMRLQYMVADVWVAYFVIRGLHWSGEKTAVSYWQEHDHTYLALFQEYVSANSLERRFAFFEKLAQETLAPVGGLWTEPGTSFSFQGEWEMGDLETAVVFWHDLLEDSEDLIAVTKRWDESTFSHEDYHAGLKRDGIVEKNVDDFD